jgi:hypothetical protein
MIIKTPYSLYHIPNFRVESLDFSLVWVSYSSFLRFFQLKCWHLPFHRAWGEGFNRRACVSITSILAHLLSIPRWLFSMGGHEHFLHISLPSVQMWRRRRALLIVSNFLTSSIVLGYRAKLFILCLQIIWSYINVASLFAIPWPDLQSNHTFIVFVTCGYYTWWRYKEQGWAMQCCKKTRLLCNMFRAR